MKISAPMQPARRINFPQLGPQRTITIWLMGERSSKRTKEEEAQRIETGVPNATEESPEQRVKEGGRTRTYARTHN